MNKPVGTMSKVQNIPLFVETTFIFELPNNQFVRVDLKANANNEWTVEHLDQTGELVAGLQIKAN